MQDMSGVNVTEPNFSSQSANFGTDENAYGKLKKEPFCELNNQPPDLGSKYYKRVFNNYIELSLPG
jgi:hypothetical protein